MKKALKIIGFGLILIILFLTQFGIDIGNIRIGKQIDLKTKQNYNFSESNFAKYEFKSNDLVILNLWATWCQPCIEEIPVLNEVQKKYSKNNIHFISLSVDNDSIKLVQFLEKKKFNFKDITIENLKYRNAILNTLEGKKSDKWISSHSVPITYLIKNKKVLKKIDGTVEKEELIKFIESNK